MLGVAIAAMLAKTLCSNVSRAAEINCDSHSTKIHTVLCNIPLWCGRKSGCFTPVFLCESSCISLCNNFPNTKIRQDNTVINEYNGDVGKSSFLKVPAPLKYRTSVF
jgi:hypothetical protein